MIPKPLKGVSIWLMNSARKFLATGICMLAPKLRIIKLLCQFPLWEFPINVKCNFTRNSCWSSIPEVKLKLWIWTECFHWINLFLHFERAAYFNKCPILPVMAFSLFNVPALCSFVSTLITSVACDSNCWLFTRSKLVRSRLTWLFTCRLQCLRESLLQTMGRYDHACHELFAHPGMPFLDKWLSPMPLYRLRPSLPAVNAASIHCLFHILVCL